METLTIRDIMQMCGVGRRTAERYARESGALLPRVKNGEYRIKRQAFLTWIRGEQR